MLNKTGSFNTCYHDLNSMQVSAVYCCVQAQEIHWQQDLQWETADLWFEWWVAECRAIEGWSCNTFFWQRAKEDVLQKEVRVKILKDNIKMLATKVPSSGQDLATELNVVLENYQLLCNRIRGKCHTLEVRRIAPCLVMSVQYFYWWSGWGYQVYP